ncbi:50S ribosomal protein L6 [Henriciella litoralis]|uniref:50S ribosomal protein L6 n=1 Tax=Henriciella litoralis TaxID=568102 RepID=UPI000A001BD2|nr:50S ribosomal protein L6 [Henriciella litoralis]
MSRIGKLPIAVPNGTTVTLNGNTIEAKGPKGNLSFTVSDLMTAELKDGEVTIMPRADYVEEANARIKANDEKGRKKMTFAEALDPKVRTQWGTARANAANVVEGASTGFTKTLELVGVGYRAQMQGNDLKLSLGYSHDVIFKAPEGIKIESSKPTEVIVSGADKQAVGQAAAEIRQFRKPEPFKGKGVRYAGEYVRRKEGKKK